MESTTYKESSPDRQQPQPARHGLRPGAAGEPSKSPGRQRLRRPEELPQSVPARGQPGASLRPPRARRPRGRGTGSRHSGADSLSWQPPLTPQKAARLLPPLPTPNPQARKAQPPSRESATTPQPDASPPARSAGLCGRGCGRADQEPSEKAGWRKGPLPSRRLQTAPCSRWSPRGRPIRPSGSF